MHAIIYKSKPLIIMMINNIIMSVAANMLIKIVLWLSEQAYSNNHKHKFITQHSKSFIRTIKTWYVEIDIKFSQLHIFI